jgi:hypothetical protein
MSHPTSFCCGNLQTQILDRIIIFDNTFKLHKLFFFVSRFKNKKSKVTTKVKVVNEPCLMVYSYFSLNGGKDFAS